MNALESVVEFVRDGIVEPNVGRKWVNSWTPLLLTLGVFILASNAIGLIPIFDVLSLLNHTVLHLPEESFMAQAASWRHHRDGQLQRDRGAGDDHVLRDHRRRCACARLRPALEEPGAARPAAAA